MLPLLLPHGFSWKSTLTCLLLLTTKEEVKKLVVKENAELEDFP